MADRDHHFWRTVRGEIPLSPCAKLIGRTVLEAEPDSGRITVRFDAPESMTNPAGQIQGGFVAVMLDETMGPALGTTFETGEFGPTLEMKINFLRPVAPGTVIGRGRVVRRSGSIAFVEGVLESPSGEEIAIGSCTAKIIRRAL